MEVIFQVLNFLKDSYQRTVEFVKVHPGGSVLTAVMVIAGMFALSLVDLGNGGKPDSVTGVGPKGARIGGIDIQGYCTGIHYVSGRLDHSNPQAPRVICYTRIADEPGEIPQGSVSISMAAACDYHYDLQAGQHFSFVYDDSSDLNTGKCYVEPGHQVAGTNGGLENLSGYCKGKYQNMPNVKARSDLLVQGKKSWACSVAVGGAEVCQAGKPNYKEYSALYTEGELVCYGSTKS